MPSINSILIKRNNLSGTEPNVSDLTLGELALNTADGKLFIRTETADLTSISTFLNSKDLPYVLNESLSSINTQHGGNTVSQVFGAVLGGYKNDNSGAGSTVINGENNDIDGDFSTILNGLDNKIQSTGDYSAILGGKSNLISHENSFTIGSNLSSHANNFTYVNNISAQGVMYGDGSGLTNLAAASAPDLAVRSLTANWESTYTTVKSNSSTNWDNGLANQYTQTNFLPLSGGTLTGTIVGNVSSTGSFYGDGSNLTGIVAGDTVATTLVRSNSGYWESTYTTVNNISTNWNSAYTTVQSNSATNWNYQGTDLKDLSGNWQGTYTTVQSNSAVWGTAGAIPATDVQIFTSSGTWTKPAGAKSVDVNLIAGGGGGSSGRVNAGQAGGGGGAGGNVTHRAGIPASILGATEAVTVGAGGIGGASTNIINAQNTFGTNGGASSFGVTPWVFASAGNGAATSNGGAGGAGGRGFFIGGAGGNGGGQATPSVGASPGAPQIAAGGGGGGGSCSTAGQFYAGGNGLPSLGYQAAGGQAVGGTTAGAAGAAGAAGIGIIGAGGGGGGGAGNAAGNAGAGGNASVYGGGGGGGGCCGWVPGTSGQTYSSGKGGDGAQGIVIITTYF